MMMTMDGMIIDDGFSQEGKDRPDLKSDQPNIQREKETLVIWDLTEKRSRLFVFISSFSCAGCHSELE